LGVRPPRGLCGRVAGFPDLAKVCKGAGRGAPERKPHRVERTEPLRALRAFHRGLV